MSGIVQFRPFEAEDVIGIKLQPRQHREMGLWRPVASIEDGEYLLDAGEAWTAIGGGGRILCCSGFAHLFPGTHGLAWSMLAEGLGRAHVEITRFARARLAESRLRRIEAIIALEHDEIERDAGYRWAKAVGLQFVHVLRNYGPECRTHLLFERIV